MTLLQENYFCYDSQTRHYPSEQRVQRLKPPADEVEGKLLTNNLKKKCFQIRGQQL